MRYTFSEKSSKWAYVLVFVIMASAPAVYLFIELLKPGSRVRVDALHIMAEALCGIIFLTMGIIQVARHNAQVSQNLKVTGTGLMALGIMMLGHPLVQDEHAAFLLHTLAFLISGLFMLQVFFPPLCSFWNRYKNSYWWMVLFSMIPVQFLVFWPHAAPPVIDAGQYTILTRVLSGLATLIYLVITVSLIRRSWKNRNHEFTYLGVLTFSFSVHLLLFQYSSYRDSMWWFAWLALVVGAVMAFWVSVAAYTRLLTVLHDNLAKVQLFARKMARSEQKYRSTFTHMVDAYAAHRVVRNEAGHIIDYVFLDVNPAFEEMTGKTAGELSGKRVTEVFRGIEHDPADWIGVYAAVTETGQTTEFENFSEPLQKWFRVKAYSIEKDHFTTLFSDITSDKEASLLLQEERDRLLMSFRSMEDGVFIVNRNLELTYVNPALISVFGPHLKQSCYNYFSHQQLCQECAREKVFNGQVSHAEVTFPGLNKVYDVIYSPLMSRSGDVTEMIAIMRDVTQRKREMRELKVAKARAEESDRLKSAFLANVSHEIRTPLNGLLGFSDLLRDPATTKEEMLSYLDLMEQSGNRLLHTVSDILSISLIESRQIHPVHEPVELPGLMNSLQQTFGAEARTRNLKLIQDSPADPPVTAIYSDSQMLMVVLSNLIRNALKYTEAGHITYGYRIGGEVVQFFVRDTGIGIDPANLERIFDHFVQEDMSTARRYDGLGLGLSICKAFVNELKGSISVDSAKGEGSVFFVELPL